MARHSEENDGLDHGQAVHEGCSLLEEVLKDLDLDFILPKYLIQLLGYYGFDNHLSLSEFKDDDFNKLETFARTDLAKLLPAEEKRKFFGIYSRDTNLFKIVGGHKILVLKLSEKCKIYLQERNHRISLKRGPPECKNVKKKQFCTGTEIHENKNPDINETKKSKHETDTSSKNEISDETHTMQQTFDHVKNIVMTYQSNFLNTLEDKDQRDKGIALLKEIKIEIKTDSVLVHCLYCNFVSKAYTKFHNNRKHWILSNVNRHFRTHFKKDKCNLIPECKKWKNTTIDGYFTKGEANTNPDQASDNISEAETQSQMEHGSEALSVTQIDAVHTEVHTERTNKHIGSQVGSTSSNVNRINILSDVLLTESDSLISGQEQNFSSGRVTNEENDSANKNIVPQNDDKNDLQKLLQPLSRTRSEKLISKRRLLMDPNQVKLTDCYELCEEIEKSVANNSELSKHFEPVFTIAKELSTNQQNTTVKEKQSTFFEKLKDAALRNTHGVIKSGNAKGSRFSDSYKKFCLYLFITSGRLAYETLRANMSNALPCITTLQKSLNHYESYTEGYINMAGLETFLKKRNYPRNVIVSEDQTAVIRRVRYNPKTNQLIGCVPVISEVNGFPVKDQFKVNSVKDIEDPIKNQTLSSTAYVYMAQPLVDGAPAFCICLFGSDNRFTSEDVSHRWRYIMEEASKNGINVVGFSSDGDTRCLKNMKAFAGLSPKQVDNPYAPYFQANFSKENSLVFQDTVHIATKLKTRLLKADIILPMGKFLVSSSHLERLIGEVPKDKHLLTSSDLEGMDKMNFNAIDKLSASHVTNLLSEYDDAQATRQFLIVTRGIIDCFLDKTLSIERRIYLIWFSTFFLRLWRAWIKNNESYTLGKNWITLNTYTCVELNAHALLLLIEKMRADETINFLPWLCSSQPCEKIFRQARSMTSTYVTMVNFDMLDFTQRLRRIQAINDIISDSNDNDSRICNDLDEPRNINKNQQQEVQNDADRPSSDDPSNNWFWGESAEEDLKNPRIANTTSEVSDLNKRIRDLENEKRELLNNLEMLDTQYQQNTEKLIGVKEKLRRDFNDLEDKYAQLLDSQKRLETKRKKEAQELVELRREFQKFVEKQNSSDDQRCSKCPELFKDIQQLLSELDGAKKELSDVTSNHQSCNKLLEDIKTTHSRELGSFAEKLKLCEAENRILVAELQKSSKIVAESQQKSALDDENVKKLAEILEGYEQKVSSLEQELDAAKNQLGATKELQDQQLDGPDPHKLKLESEISSLEKVLLDRDNEIISLTNQLKISEEHKDKIHEQHISILLDNLKKHVDCQDIDFSEISTGNLQNSGSVLPEFNSQVDEVLKKVLSNFRCKDCESLREKIYALAEERDNLLTEKNCEIERLLQDLESLRQELIAKSQTITDYQNECGELIKNNDLLINDLEEYKNNSSNSGLQTISETNEDHILSLESQLEQANRKIEELEKKVAEYEIADVTTSFDENLRISKIKEYEEVTIENRDLKEEIRKLEEDQEIVLEENDKLNAALERMKLDLENTEYQYTEINVNMEMLREEVENQKNIIEKMSAQNSNLEELNREYEQNNENFRSELSSLREQLLFETDARKHLETQNISLVEKLQNSKMTETSLKLQLDTANKEVVVQTEAKNALELSLTSKLQDLDEKFSECRKTLINREQHCKELNEKVVEMGEKLMERGLQCASLEEQISEITERLAEKEQKCIHLDGELQEARKRIFEEQKQDNASATVDQSDLQLDGANVNQERLLTEIKGLHHDKDEYRKLEREPEELGPGLSATVNELGLQIESNIGKELENILHSEQNKHLSEGCEPNDLFEHSQNFESSVEAESPPKRQSSDLVATQNNLQQREVTRSNLLTEEREREYSEKIHSMQKTIDDLILEKTELTNAILSKHQESVTYHNEIQRLSQVLQNEIEKSRNLEQELQNIQKSEEATCELERLREQNEFLRQKCEVLAENLLQEQSKVQQILADRTNAQSEKEATLTKNLERLQAHLMELEEHYTQELLKAESRNAELQSKMSEIEQREKNSSTLYTSVSIRANQHVETLHNQLQLMTTQREELRKKISDYEDNANKQAAALSNLQFVLEQFQKDRDKDIQLETERIRRQINAERKIQEDLKSKISNLQCQLDESKQGLLAASRLSDQLEQSKHTITALRDEVSQLKTKLNHSEDQLKNAIHMTEGKVDKTLIKNLVVGLISAASLNGQLQLTKDQTQILRIIATVLDFNQQDHDKLGGGLGLSSRSASQPHHHQGWLGSLLSPASQHHQQQQESLSQAFVKFLESESRPRTLPSLLLQNNNTISNSECEGEIATTTTTSRNDNNMSSRKVSTCSNASNDGSTTSSIMAQGQRTPLVLSEIVLPTFADFANQSGRSSSSILKDVLKNDDR